MSAVLYSEQSYRNAIAELGEYHKCNQGCYEGHCYANAQRHNIILQKRAAEIESMQELLSVQKWIKCSDRVPDIITDYQHVIVYSPSAGYSFDAYWSRKSKKFLDEPYGTACDLPITHWMPMPMPPVDA